MTEHPIGATDIRDSYIFRQKHMNGIWAIVLAAGESKRMGSPKMLLPFDGLTIIERVIGNVMAADVDKVVVVLGAHKEEIEKKIVTYNVIISYNDHYSTGMLSSVKCGLSRLPEEYSAALILPGDHPMILTREINRVIEAYKACGRGIVMPVCQGRRGHPLIINRRYRDEVLSLPETEGLRVLAERHADDTFVIETDDPSVLRDIDTREDYVNELNKIVR